MEFQVFFGLWAGIHSHAIKNSRDKPSKMQTAHDMRGVGPVGSVGVGGGVVMTMQALGCKDDYGALAP